MQLNEYQALAQRTSRKDISKDDHLFNGILGLALGGAAMKVWCEGEGTSSDLASLGHLTLALGPAAPQRGRRGDGDLFRPPAGAPSPEGEGKAGGATPPLRSGGEGFWEVVLREGI